ncbi:class I SAM-dependent methyltransferase [Paractinoplanes atraurantiacus]|uniref:Ubiquinone/menaquinone biosynthesis C-methylase UbiE n=1 Tax=Paractinoplanes atraurantiacus TaxID=1036182 RepID=A0A285HA40_9ACTN|nr:class I SAM-dependent methyltransferase [Actinoplanes atraurantiacus]SNY32595.1 Ubiquinone/menaquinone biosynthesis C-methylase UbiE [Actinoplanes atraurantiacus]
MAVYDAENVWGWDDDFFMAVLAERTSPRVLDFGCGTGRLAIAMAAAGHEVTGVDPARASLDAARRKPGAERVRWIEGSVEALPERSFDAALLTSHVAQFFVGDEEWSSALRALRRSLLPGGRLIFDSRDPVYREWERWNPTDSRRVIVLPDGGLVVAWTEVNDRNEGTISFTHHFAFTESDELISEATLRFRSEEELRADVEAAGFDVDRVYGGWAREPAGLGEDGELIMVAVARPQGTG